MQKGYLNLIQFTDDLAKAFAPAPGDKNANYLTQAFCRKISAIYDEHREMQLTKLQTTQQHMKALQTDIQSQLRSFDYLVLKQLTHEAKLIH